MRKFLARVAILALALIGNQHAQSALVGRHTCGIPIGTKGNHLALQSSGAAHDAAMIAMAADI
jgi:hypothetical protein